MCEKFVMQPGTYYLGDLCYVMHQEWSEVCDLLFAGQDNGGVNEGTFNLKDGRTFALFSTAYGDGTYPDNKGNMYPVDAGSIGCIKVDEIDLSVMDNSLNGGHVYSFDNDFEVYSDGRVLTFGDVSIDTDPLNDYDEE